MHFPIFGLSSPVNVNLGYLILDTEFKFIGKEGKETLAKENSIDATSDLNNLLFVNLWSSFSVDMKQIC